MPQEKFWTPEAESDRRFLEELIDAETPEDFLSEKTYSHEKIPHDLIPTEKLFDSEGVTLEDVHEWYASAIARRERSALAIDRFIGHFEGLSSDPTYAFGERDKGYLLGYLKYGVFVPTHFAPKTMRGGYELMKKLGDSENTPAIMSVTEDLSDTLAKMPSWKALDMGFLASFREELKEKKIVYNSHPDTKNLMFGLVSEYMAEHKGDQ